MFPECLAFMRDELEKIANGGGMQGLPGVINNKFGGEAPPAKEAPLVDRVREVVEKKKQGMDPAVAAGPLHRAAPAMSWGQATKDGLHHEGPGAAGMTLGAIVGGRYGRPLEGAGIGYGLGAAGGILADKAVGALRAAKASKVVK